MSEVVFIRTTFYCTIQGVSLKTGRLYGDGADSGPVTSGTLFIIICKRNSVTNYLIIRHVSTCIGHLHVMV